MTTEQKAKAYDEAVINGSRLWECGEITRENYEYIFPELKDEDERIRKAIIATIHLYYGEPLEDEAKEMIAWLEKQGEKKSSWSKEDEQYLLVCKNALAKYQTTDKWDANIIYNWLKNKLQKL